jgi:hypothetical protein
VLAGAPTQPLVTPGAVAHGSVLTITCFSWQRKCCRPCAHDLLGHMGSLHWQAHCRQCIAGVVLWFECSSIPDQQLCFAHEFVNHSADSISSMCVRSGKHDNYICSHKAYVLSAHVVVATPKLTRDCCMHSCRLLAHAASPYHLPAPGGRRAAQPGPVRHPGGPAAVQNL